jgi:hypothetical protein
MEEVMKNKRLSIGITILFLGLFFATNVFAWDFGADWTFNWCTKCKKYFKHVGKDISAKANQKVIFTDNMYFVKKGSDGEWHSYLVARDAKNTYTYVVWHMDNIPNFKSGDSLNGKQIGTVANMGSNTHIHVGFRNAPSNDFVSQRGALPNCNHNKPAYSGGKDLPQYPEKFADPKIRVNFR